MVSLMISETTEIEYWPKTEKEKTSNKNIKSEAITSLSENYILILRGYSFNDMSTRYLVNHKR